MNFIIPDLVRVEVQSVVFSLRQTIQKVCHGGYNGNQYLASTSTNTTNSTSLTPQTTNLSLDAPSYLYVSTYVFINS